MYVFQALHVSLRMSASEARTDTDEMRLWLSTNSRERPSEACQAMWQWTSLCGGVDVRKRDWGTPG